MPRLHPVTTLLRLCLALASCTSAAAAHAEELAAVYAKSVAAVKAGDLETGARLSQRAYELSAEANGAQSAQTGILAYNTGVLYSQTRQYALAEEHLLAALEVYAAVHGKRAPELLPIMEQLQQVYQQTRDAVGAVTLLEQRVAVESELHGEKSLETATAMRSYAVALAFAHHARRARQILRKAMKIFRELEGEESVGVGETFLAMAAVELADRSAGLSNLEKAPKYAEEGERILLARLPTGDPRLVQLYTEALRLAQETGLRREIEAAQAKLDEQLAAARGGRDTAVDTSPQR